MKLIISIVLLFTCIVVLMALAKTRDQIKRMKTLDTMGLIIVTLNKTLGTEPLEQYNPAKETQRIFPLVSSDGNQIIDAWSKPIKILITKNDKGFIWKITSSGQDGVFGSKDDLINDGFFSITNALTCQP